ncbi:hypothetical protein GCM10023149_01790 [Mucilaginibacter gynuensis]|uniref:HTH hxlR-type domain-containing protein n=1 Tax=Mucilaginibacter gynuensis TaxID=1302236 RepID=A0ABP8FNZ4_9SPHI
MSFPKDTGIVWDTAYLQRMKTDLTNGLGSKHPCAHNACAEGVTGIRDALYVLNGKWKLPLVFALTEGPMRFKDIQRSVGDITAKVLSKELKELELNEFVVRTVLPTVPVSVSYELTSYSCSLESVLMALKDWGIRHRRRIIASRKTGLSD